MQTRILQIPVIAALLMTCITVASSKAETNTPKVTSESTFMRQKLKAMNQIVEGIATEDFKLIGSGGQRLLELSEDAAWQVRRDPMYMHYSSAFQTNVNGLLKAAEQESLGDATLSYMNITVSCVACHKHVRGVIQMAPANAAGFQNTFR